MRKFFVLVAGFTLLWLDTGCNRPDTEAISRIGRKIAAHTRNGAAEISGKLDLPYPEIKREPALREVVQERLRWENNLREVSLEVHVKEKEVTLKGSVPTEQHRQRAMDLAGSVVGVEKVTDAMQVNAEN